MAPMSASKALPNIERDKRVELFSESNEPKSSDSPTLLSVCRLTIFERIFVKKPSSLLGYLQNKYSATIEPKTASPRYSKRSLF